MLGSGGGGETVHDLLADVCVGFELEFCIFGFCFRGELIGLVHCELANLGLGFKVLKIKDEERV